MPVDLFREGDRYVLNADLPGVDPGSVDIDVDGHLLTIRAQRSAGNRENFRWLAQERPFGSYQRQFTIGDDIRTHVYVKGHKTVVTKNGHVIRTMLSDAGNPEFPSWDGTMAVVNKERTSEMTSCSVHIACNPKDPNFYDITLPWDVRITNSGTFLHYSTGDPYPGHAYGSHGCVHLSYKDAEWYYNLSKQGDPVTITGSPRGKAAGDNGYADYDVPWSEWLADSGMKQFTTTA